MLRSATLSLPELALVGGTRALLGAGIALLLADRGDREQRRAVGWTLMAVGLATTVPLALDIFLSGQTARPKEEPPRFPAEGEEAERAPTRERRLSASLM